jgi:hypothetical protein
MLQSSFQIDGNSMWRHSAQRAPPQRSNFNATAQVLIGPVLAASLRLLLGARWPALGRPAGAKV